ncbi:MAG: NADPH:quinone oxidoreductase family protein [Phyllobacteriaceae bacterium]|nr:NADPH:quinone oxidoreductase family protein [Phyllobacteriaceae bacterium]
MKAIVCRAHGPASGLVHEELPDPVAGPGEVVVAMRACALNFFDTLIIRDRYQFKPALPFSPGGEIAGVVESLGPGVAGVAVGDRVVAYVKWGGAREKVVAKAADLVALPADLDFVRASALSVTYGTAVHGLVDRGELKPGETVAILGASGGVGQAAIEVAKAVGARVIACASGAEKLAFCRDVGADETVDYDVEDLKTRLKELTDGRGVDVVYDAVGDRYTEPAVRATAWRGRYLVVGFAAGEIPRIPLNLLLLKGCDLRGVFWGDHLVREPEAFRREMAEIMTWVGEGRLRPHIHAVRPLAETAAAIEEIAARKVKGKIVVTAG